MKCTVCYSVCPFVVLAPSRTCRVNHRPKSFSSSKEERKERNKKNAYADFIALVDSRLSRCAKVARKLTINAQPFLRLAPRTMRDAIGDLVVQEPKFLHNQPLSH